MSKTNYVFTDVEKLIESIRKVDAQYPGRVWVTGVTSKSTAKAHTKARKVASLQMEHCFSPTVFSGNEVIALTSGGSMFLLHIPADKVSPELLKSRGESE